MTGHARARRTPTLKGVKSRYLLAATAFVTLAILRAGHGEYAWAAVFALAAVANAWLAVPPARRYRREETSRPRPPGGTGPDTAMPSVAAGKRAGRGRTWSVLAAVAIGLAAALVAFVPALAVVAAALALLALHQARKSRYAGAV